MQYYQHHIGDYIKDTAHLSVLEDGIYRRLIDLYYTRDGDIPQDLNQIARLIGARSEIEVQTTSNILQEFFKNKDGKWSHIRCDKEIAKSKAFIRDGKKGAEIRWGKRATQQEKNSPPMSTPMLTNNHKPITNIIYDKTASPLSTEKQEEKSNFTDVRNQLAQGMTFKATRGISKAWQEEAFRYADGLKITLNDSQKGRWLKFFKDAHTIRPQMRPKIQIAFTYLSDLHAFTSLEDSEAKIKFFWEIAYNGTESYKNKINNFQQRL